MASYSSEGARRPSTSPSILGSTVDSRPSTTQGFRNATISPPHSSGGHRVLSARSAARMAESMPSMTPGPSPDRAHIEWAIRMWKRMDRDNSGTLTRKELDCEEMRAILRMILIPQDGSHAVGGGPSYARSSMNHTEALSFCVRKADVNNDGILSFEEFKCFTWELRQKSGKQTAGLIFALFDLDSDHLISESEFREIYRFYLGHHPTFNDFTEEWARLYQDGVGRGVTRERYMRWLETSASPIFRRHLFFNTKETHEKKDAADMMAGAVLAGASRRMSKQSQNSALKNMTFLQLSKSATRIKKDADGWPLGPRKDIKDRPKWNQKWNWQLNPNDDLPCGERVYFSKSQSLPQLRRFLANHAGCERQHQKLTSPSQPKRLKVVSTDTSDDVITDPGRHLPGGYMTEYGSGEMVLWEDRWQTPLRFRRRFKLADRPLAPHSLFEASHQHLGPMAPRLNRLYG